VTTNCTVSQVTWAAARGEIEAVRRAVFIEELGIPPELEWDAHDATALHVLARLPDGRAVGTGRLLPEGRIGRVAVLPAWRGRGVGGAVLAALVAAAAARGHRALVLSAQLPVVVFYRRRGWVPRGPVYQAGGLPHRDMVLDLCKSLA